MDTYRYRILYLDYLYIDSIACVLTTHIPPQRHLLLGFNIKMIIIHKKELLPWGYIFLSMIHKVTTFQIALVQLRTSVQLYNKRNFISAITLAGAAEEILGDISKGKAGTNSVIEDKVWTDQIADYYKRKRLP